MGKILNLFLIALLTAGGLFLGSAHDVVQATQTYTINATAGINGSISPLGPKIVDAGSIPTYTIKANSGYQPVVEVNGSLVQPVAVASTPGTYTYKFPPVNFGPQTISATFLKVSYTITAYSTGSYSTDGTVSPNTTVTNFGNNVSVTIIPAAKYFISKVTDTVGSSVVNVSINAAQVSSKYTYSLSNVSASHAILVYFAPIVPKITVNAVTNGSITLESGTVAYGTTPTYSITPKSSNYVISAVTVNGAAVPTFTPPQSTFNYTFSASSMSIEQTQTIGATFAPSTYAITATAGAGGSILSNKASPVAYGASPIYTITPNTSSGYQISKVTDNGTDVTGKLTQTSSNPPVFAYSISNVTAIHTISAAFSLIPYTITVDQGINGVISPSATANVSYTASNTYTITPNIGYKIGKVTDTVGGVVNDVTSQLTQLQSNPLAFTYSISKVTASHMISATFSLIPYTITASQSSNGTISPAGVVSINYTTSPKIYAITPAQFYKLSSVIIDGTALPQAQLNNVLSQSPPSYTFSKVTANHTISATFSLISYTITSSVSGSNGTISPTGTQTVNAGSPQIYTIKADSGYHPTVYVNNILIPSAQIVPVTSTPNAYTYTFPANTATNQTISVSFSLDQYTVIATSTGQFGTDGTIGYTDPTTGKLDTSAVVNSGDTSPTFAITPKTGYQIASITVNNTVLTTTPLPTSYSFSNVTADQTISVTFAPLPAVLVTPSAGAVINSNSVNFSWKGTGITYYLLRAGSTQGGNDYYGIGVGSITNTSEIVTTIPLNGQTVYVQLSSLINGSWENNDYEFQAQLLAPANLKATAGNTQVTLSWTKVTGATSYNIYENNDLSTPVATGVTDTTYVVSNLTNNTSYAFTVAAENAALQAASLVGLQSASVSAKPIPYTIAASLGSSSAAGSGTITASSSTVTLDGSITFTITPAAGYALSSLTVTSGSNTPTTVPAASLPAPINGVYTYILSDITGNEKVVANFSAIAYSITASESGNGSISSAGTKTYGYNATPTYTFTPANNNLISSVTVNGTLLTPVPTSSYMFPPVTISGQTINVTFVPSAYSITTSVVGGAGGNGTISGPASVGYQSSGSYLLTPDSGYQVSMVTDNGTNVTSQLTPASLNSSAYTYSISNVVADHSISVTFAPAQFTVSAASTGSYGADGTIGYTNSTGNFETTAVVNNGSSSPTFIITPNTGYQIASIAINNNPLTTSPLPSTYTFTNVTANQTISVTFSPASTYTVSVSVSGATGSNVAGTITANPGIVTQGGSSSLTITPSSTYQLSSLTFINGANTTTLPVASLSAPSNGVYTYVLSNITSNQSVVANFIPLNAFAYTTLVMVGGVSTSAAGTITCMNNNAAVACPSSPVNASTVVQFYANPKTGYTLVNWSVSGSTPGSDCSGATGTCTVTVTGNNTSVAANFSPVSETLSTAALPSGDGSVTCGSTTGTCASAANYGSSIVFYANSKTGYTLTGWSVSGSTPGSDCSGVSGTCTVTVTANNTSVTANFTAVIETLSIAALPSSDGSVTCGSTTGTCASSAGYGSSVVFYAHPKTGYTLENWSVSGSTPGADCSGTSGTCTVAITADNTSVTANFIPITYTITATAGNGGTISPSGPTTVSYSGSQTYTITYKLGYQVSAITINGAPLTTTPLPLTYTFSNVTGPQTINVTFVSVPTYSITTTPANITCGNTSSACPSPVSEGASVEFFADPPSGYAFSSWSVSPETTLGGDCSGNTGTCTVIITADTTVTANYVQVYTLTVFTPKVGGTVAQSVNNGVSNSPYLNGTTVTLTAMPAAGYQFLSWDGAVSGTSTTATLTINGNETVIANFIPLNYYNPVTQINAPGLAQSFAAAVAVYGNDLLVSDPGNSGGGVIDEYTNANGQWSSNPTYTIPGPGSSLVIQANDNFGSSMVENKEGTLLAVANNPSGNGTAIIYMFNNSNPTSGNVWSFEYPIDLPGLTGLPQSYFQNISLAMDNGLLVVGAPVANEVFVFSRIPAANGSSVTWQESNVLTQSGAVYFGASVDILWPNIVVGAPNLSNSYLDQSQVFSYVSSSLSTDTDPSWSSPAVLSSSDPNFGVKVGIGASGSTLVVGDPLISAQNPGEILIYSRGAGNGAWNPTAQQLPIVAPLSGNTYGDILKVNNNQMVIEVHQPSASGYTGGQNPVNYNVVYQYNSGDNNWDWQYTTTGQSVPSPHDSVDIAGNDVVAGQPLVANQPAEPGANGSVEVVSPKS